MSDMRFSISAVDNKPRRKYRKGSKYDPIIDSFLEGEDNLVSVKVPDKEPNYLRMQLHKRIEKRGLSNVDVCVVSNYVFLEKV